MKPSFRLMSIFLVALWMPALAAACLWDFDTLKQERARFPSTLELITGKFLRHSIEFYEWRIQDRLNKLKTEPTNLALHDDLAVAYEKTDQHAQAIKTILAKEAIQPGRYETYSNLGTFHILAGDFEQGLPFIDKALALNPEAHFGRERYQKWLVEYALTRLADGRLRFPLRMNVEDAKEKNVAIDFRDYLRQQLGTQSLSIEESQKAVQGVLGMMRFANHSNPLLLEALGDLLVGASNHDSTNDAKNLATRCYLKASYEFAGTDEVAQQRFRELASESLMMQTDGLGLAIQLDLADLEMDFKAELADAEQWYADLKAQEVGWIQNGLDADAEFDRLYSREPVSLNQSTNLIANPTSPTNFVTWMAIATLSLAVMLVMRYRDRRDPPQHGLNRTNR